MIKKSRAEGALFVRLPATAVEKLDRAARALGVRKKDLVAGLVSRHVDPDSRQGLAALGTLGAPRVPAGFTANQPLTGSYSFHAHDPPEVMNAEQAGQFLQLSPSVVVELAEGRKLPGRKVAAEWRFSRAALLAWLAGAETR